MAFYTGNHCPVCNRAFTENDDIVVCPDCGTPYHRACWQKAGACVHADKHASGFTWQPDAQPQADPDQERACPNCGARNPAGSQFCNHCGVPLAGAPRAGQAGSGRAGGRPDGASFGGGAQSAASAAQQDAGFRFFRQELSPDDTIEGIKARDWATFVGPSSLSYLAQFVRMEVFHRKTSVSLSAFFLGPIFFFYRKMWKPGLLFALVELLMAAPTMLLLFAAAGSPLASWVSVDMVNVLSTVCFFLNWAQMILRSLFAFYWYRQTASRRIHEICDRLPEGQDRSDALAIRGGTSVVAVLLYFAALFALAFAMVWLMGPGRSEAMALLMRSYMM